MRVFLSEFVCGGGWPHGCPDGSLQAEGQAMLTAVAADFARIAGCHVVTTWDARLGPFPLEGIDVVLLSRPEDELACFERLADECDAALVIAPEFHGLLAERCATVERLGRRLLGPSSEIVRLCGDKLRLARHLGERGVPVIPTESLPAPAEWGALPFPIVIKPRYGAGAANTFLARSADELAGAHRRGFDPPDLPPDVWQPFVPGRSLSVSVIAAEDRSLDLLPVGEQKIVLEAPDDAEGASRRFSYSGGRIPAEDCPTQEVSDLIRRACAALGPGVRGYLGFDLILSDAGPVLVEINPRLTTSYIGYRALTEENLAERMLAGGTGFQPVGRGIGFQPVIRGLEAAAMGSRQAGSLSHGPTLVAVEFSPSGTVRPAVQ